MTVQWRRILGRFLGSMYDGERNLYTTYGYAQIITYDDMLRMYSRQDIVSRIANAYPDAIWARMPNILNNDNLNDSLIELNKSVSLAHYINRVDRLASIGKYAVMVLGLDDVGTSEDFSKPVRGKNRKLLYVQVYGYGAADISEWETDTTSPYFGLPKIYNIKTSQTVDAAGNKTPKRGLPNFRVHRDRVIHVADCQLDSDIEGYPIVERVINRLYDLEKVVGGAAEMFFQNGRTGLHLNLDKDTKTTPQDEEILDEEINDYLNNLQRVIRTRGMEAKMLKSETVNPEPVFNVIMSIISVTTGIPQRIFIGSEQGKLASEQDRSNWAIRINERRMQYAEPRILRPLIARLQGFGVVKGGDYDVEWPDAFQMSPLERSQTAAQQARAATNIANTITKQRRLLSRREGRTIIFARGELKKEGDIDRVNDT